MRMLKNRILLEYPWDSTSYMGNVPVKGDPVDFYPFFRAAYYGLTLEDVIVLRWEPKGTNPHCIPFKDTVNEKYKKMPRKHKRIKGINECNIITAQLMYGLKDPREVRSKEYFDKQLKRMLSLINKNTRVYTLKSEKLKEQANKYSKVPAVMHMVEEQEHTLNTTYGREMEVLGAMYSMYQVYKRLL